MKTTNQNPAQNELDIFNKPSDLMTNPLLLYPESSLLVAMAETAWAGNLKSVKIEFSLSDRLKAKLTELLFTKKIEGTFYLASIEKGNNQIGIITLWKKKK